MKYTIQNALRPVQRQRHAFAPLLAALMAAVTLLGGCSSTPPSNRATAENNSQERADAALSFKSALGSAQHRISIQELDQLTYGYADRYFMIISSAVDAIKKNNPDPTQRRIAHQIKLNGVQAMNDIVSGNDPYAQTLDLVVSVTLESILLIDENQAEQVFGDRAPILISAIRTMRVEAWDLAAKILTQEQLELLDYIILEWRRAHRDIDQVAYVKFDNFAGARAAGLLSDLKSGGGFLAPISEASLVLKDWGRLTERAFWYSKRAPNIAAIQAEGAVNEILSAPEINSVLQATDRVGHTAESLPQTIDAQRKAFFAELDSRQTLLTNTLADLRHIVAGANSLSTNVQQSLVTLGQTLQIADGVGRTFGVDRPSTNPPGRPFDVLEYTAALTRLNDVVTNLHQLSLGVDQLTRSEGWKSMLRDMTDATDRRVDRVFSRLCMALGLAFVLAVIYRGLSLRMARRWVGGMQQKS